MTAIIVIVVVVILAAWLVSMYNSLVKMRNNRENAFADSSAMTWYLSWWKQ